jgi:hypothetical protein
VGRRDRISQPIDARSGLGAAVGRRDRINHLFLRLFKEDEVLGKGVERSDRIGQSSVPTHIHGNRRLGAGVEWADRN